VLVRKLQLIGFRNYIEAAISFDASKTIIIGNNAQGKTNLLEAIQVLTSYKSRRATKDIELINFELNEAVLRAEISKESDISSNQISMLIRPSGRRTLKVNDVNKKAKELSLDFASVSFMVDDLEIINGSPSGRRNFLDNLLAKLFYSYADDLDAFEDILLQRNSYLKSLQEKNIYHINQLQDRVQLSIWDQMFVDKANRVSRHRSQLIKQLEPVMKNYYQRISNQNHDFELIYQGAQISQNDLDLVINKDLARGITNIGPQRDDIEFRLKYKDAASYASQGEKRSLALALKLAELELLKDKFSEYPILLLDDVLAELDEDRQDLLLECIEGDIQVIISTTHLGKHLEKWSRGAQILTVNNGVIAKLDEAKI